MKKRLRVSVEATHDEDEFYIDFEDLNTTEEDWDKLSEDKQIEILDEYVNEHRETPSWCIDRIKKINSKND